MRDWGARFPAEAGQRDGSPRGPEETSDCQYAKATAQEEGMCGYVIN